MATVYQQLSPEAAAFAAATFPQYNKVNGTNFPVTGLYYDAAADEAAFWKIEALSYGSGNLTLDLEWYADTATSQVVASVSGAVGSVTGAVGSVTGNVGGNVVGSVASVTGNVGGNVTGSVGSVLAGVSLAAAAIQAIWDALTANLTTVGSIGKRIADNLDAAISSRLASASYTTPPTVLAIADQVWDEVLAGHLVAGSTGAALNAAGSAGDPWSTALPGAYGAGTAGKIVGDNINATIGSRSTVTTAQVNAEVLDVLTVDTFAEVVSAPAATSTLKDKIGWLFKLARNRRTTTAVTDTLYNDAGAVADSISTISDDGTTFTRGKYT